MIALNLVIMFVVVFSTSTTTTTTFGKKLFFSIPSSPFQMHHLQMARNHMLRVYLTKFQKQNILSVSKFYHSCLGKLNDLHLFYYSLEHDDKEIIENMVSLIFF
jgi:hypothetical protein